MVVGAAGDEGRAAVQESRRQSFGVDDDLPRIIGELGAQRLAERDRLGRHHLHNRAALKAGENRLVDAFAEVSVAAQNQAAARAAQ